MAKVKVEWIDVNSTWNETTAQKVKAVLEKQYGGYVACEFQVLQATKEDYWYGYMVQVKMNKPSKTLKDEIYNFVRGFIAGYFEGEDEGRKFYSEQVLPQVMKSVY